MDVEIVQKIIDLVQMIFKWMVGSNVSGVYKTHYNP